MKRTTFLLACLLVLVTACSERQPVTFEPPKPSGPHPVGTTATRLEDTERGRELMISLWYPAKTTAGLPVAPWMPKAAAEHYMRDQGITGLRLDRTSGYEGAPMDTGLGKLPVILYSPGLDASRSYGTGVAQELASRGFVVVTIDHPYDAAVVEFPGGRVVAGKQPTDLDQAVVVRVADVRFVLDQLPSLDKAGSFDLERIGMFGHSLGAWTTASAMFADTRIKAGFGLDGAKLGKSDEGRGSLDRPFVVVDTTGKGGMDKNPLVRQFWDKLTGWRLHLTIKGAGHNSMGDDVVLIRLAAAQLGLGKADLEELVGTIPVEQALAFQREYPAAFFDEHLRSHPSALLKAPSAQFPEIGYQR
ncbi:lipase [Streptosporangium sp. NPDC006013]|uniref:alpha/beta hydrolase family protein n=1 Tax=Streptosporangium sp. NPDC006013 TaxID=3155596 RepID=UPI0033A501BA